MVRAVVPCFAKLNLDLRVLGRRTDGYHELRTIFQTIDLADRLTIEAERADCSRVTADSSVAIPDNLVVRAAEAVLSHLKINARVHCKLIKKIPMGAGLGGGSSDAAAVVLGLPELLGEALRATSAMTIAAELGSDVPFFLYGGTAIGLSRGTELYPCPPPPYGAALLVTSAVHVATADAYQGLSRPALTSADYSPILREFQALTFEWDAGRAARPRLHNDFEDYVVPRHPELQCALAAVRRTGAGEALMTGSGSAVFGLFARFSEARKAAEQFAAARRAEGTGGMLARAVRLVSRKQFRSRWKRALSVAGGAERMFADADLNPEEHNHVRS